MAEQIDALVKEHKPRVLALDMSRVFDLEYSALHTLVENEKRAAIERYRALQASAGELSQRDKNP